MIPIIATLASQGLSLIANAVMSKGKDYIEEKTGVKLDPEMTPEQLTQLKQYELENEKELRDLQMEDNKLSEALAEKVIDADVAAEKGITDRWTADTTAGDMLTKRIRPSVLIYLLGLFTVFSISSAYGVVINDGYVQLIGQWTSMVMTAYFGGRSMEKIAEMYYNHKVEISKGSTK